MRLSKFPIAVTLCCVYLVLTGFVPVIGVLHDFSVTDHEGTHDAIDGCTWLEDAVASSLLTGIDAQKYFFDSPAQIQNRYFVWLSYAPSDCLRARPPPPLRS